MADQDSRVMAIERWKLGLPITRKEWMEGDFDGDYLEPIKGGVPKWMGVCSDGEKIGEYSLVDGVMPFNDWIPYERPKPDYPEQWDENFQVCEVRCQRGWFYYRPSLSDLALEHAARTDIIVYRMPNGDWSFQGASWMSGDNLSLNIPVYVLVPKEKACSGP